MAANPEFDNILGELKDLHDRKNANYAASDDPYANFRLCETFGIPMWLGLLTRMSDKWSRLINLAGGVQDKVGETLEDTLTDLIVYGIILKAVLRHKLGAIQ